MGDGPLITSYHPAAASTARHPLRGMMMRRLTEEQKKRETRKLTLRQTTTGISNKKWLEPLPESLSFSFFAFQHSFLAVPRYPLPSQLPSIFSFHVLLAFLI